MKLSYLLTCCSLFLLMSVQPAHAVVHIKPEAKVERTAEGEAALSKKELKKAKRQQRKQFKQALKAQLKQLRQGNDTDLILLVILAILLPPLAMGLYDGISTRFWISLLLTLLFFVPGMIYTLVVILSEN